ncbi:hypothetical protein P20495_4209 [Pseudoalteromonas sp. BSi20495]|nr:hypothetical protein P20495_4209 [Pseudoalteromonas sp. BSi20495]
MNQLFIKLILLNHFFNAVNELFKALKFQHFNSISILFMYYNKQ